MRQLSADRIAAILAWLGTFGAALTVAGVQYPGRTLFTLLFLMVTPAVCVAQLVPGLDPPARAVLSVAGGIVLISIVAEVMLAAKWWSPRGGVIAVGALCAVVLALAPARRSRTPEPPAPAAPAVPGPRPEPSVPVAAAKPPPRRAHQPDDDAWLYEE
ncbi:MAG TPA: hypothetical protein VFU43_26250 [Streptosporangiaceae bacterium]|nr:hypothetical protein [Streptosporangiaceae bacterium]